MQIVRAQRNYDLMVKAKTFLLIAVSAFKDKGVSFFFRRFLAYAVNFWTWQYYKRFPANKTFVLGGKSHRYFYHLYNVTWENERSVEIALALDFLKQYGGQSTLEVGNVLSWYIPIRHEVLDKYEIAAGVINEDIVEFKPPENYSLIICISTLEHVGWDEKPRTPHKVFEAAEHLKSLLRPGGQLLVTVPLGYNTALDEFIEQEQISFTQQYF